MSDLHPPPPDPPTNGTNPAGPPDIHPSGPTTTAAAVSTTSKRQRRPSVRLGDIGEQIAASDAFLRRPKLFKPAAPSLGPTTCDPTTNPNPSLNKTRTLNHLDPLPESVDNAADTNLENLAASVRNRNPKYPRRGRKIRSSWTLSSKPDADEDEDEGFHSEFDDLRRDDSISPSDRDRVRPGPPSEPEARDWNENGNVGLDEDGGVRSWLNRLELGRYAPVFEIHEVDDEVLPLLTLEDLKDMGINAIGSRRKMYCAIQKLKKNST